MWKLDYNIYSKSILILFDSTFHYARCWWGFGGELGGMEWLWKISTVINHLRVPTSSLANVNMTLWVFGFRWEGEGGGGYWLSLNNYPGDIPFASWWKIFGCHSAAKAAAFDTAFTFKSEEEHKLFQWITSNLSYSLSGNFRNRCLFKTI